MKGCEREEARFYCVALCSILKQQISDLCVNTGHFLSPAHWC